MFQLSLRGLLVFTALCALAIVSLRWASEGWLTVVLTVTLLAFWTSLIVAVVDRGKRQAFAIGFAVSMVVYGMAVLLAAPLGAPMDQNPELNPATGRLPTTRLLNPVFTAVAEVRWFNFQTGQEVVQPDAQSVVGGGAMPNVTASELPDRGTFMAIGHRWWALIFGYCGGWFARFVYLRRNREQSSLASGRS